MDNELSKIIGTRINTLLAKSGKKQKDLAQYLGVKDNTISYFISGTRTPNTEQIKKIATFFNTSADYLLGLFSEPSNDKDITFVCEYTGLSEKAVNCLKRKKKNIFFMSAVNWLIEQQTLLIKLGNYLFSSVYTLFHQSEYYNKLPLKEECRYIKVPDLAPKIHFANVIELLPLEELKLATELKKNQDEQEKLLFSLACQIVDIKECERIAEYGNSDIFSSDEPPYFEESPYDEDEDYENYQKSLFEEEKAIEWTEKREEIIRDFLISREAGENNG